MGFWGGRRRISGSRGVLGGAELRDLRGRSGPCGFGDQSPGLLGLALERCRARGGTTTHSGAQGLGGIRSPGFGGAGRGSPALGDGRGGLGAGIPRGKNGVLALPPGLRGEHRSLPGWGPSGPGWGCLGRGRWGSGVRALPGSRPGVRGGGPWGKGEQGGGGRLPLTTGDRVGWEQPLLCAPGGSGGSGVRVPPPPLPWHPWRWGWVPLLRGE